MPPFIPGGGRDKSARLIIPPALVRRFRDLKKFCYEARNPGEAILMIKTVLQESAEVLENYNVQAVGPLIEPVFVAARDGLAAVILHMKETGAEAAALQEAERLWAGIEEIRTGTRGMSGNFEIPS